MNNSFYIADLIVKKIKGQISPDESQELQSWIDKSSENQTVYNKAIDRKNQLSKLEIYQLFNKEKAWKSLEAQLFKTKTISFTSSKFYRYAAAIAIPFLLTGSIIFYLMNDSQKDQLAELDSIVKPGTQKAVLILADGGQIELDDAKPVTNIEQGKTKITNTEKTLSYSTNEETEAKQELIFNELKTPRGGGYNLKLADGTQVWLNAGSNLKFPVSFTDSTRQVYLEGEAYFDVTHTGKPFIVTTEDMNVRVLGTSFNVSAYSDEQEVKTTLVDGKVGITLKNDITNNTNQIVLSPNDQATIDKSESNVNVTEVNTSQYTSWITGKLEFNNQTLGVVMKRLARWYDFEYKFENTDAKDFHFTARIDNTENISSVLKMLEMTTDVKFEIKENTIVIN